MCKKIIMAVHQGNHLSGKPCLKLFIVSCIFASIQVFSTCTSVGMIWVTLNMLSAVEECREPSGKGIVREFHIVWRVVTWWYHTASFFPFFLLLSRAEMTGASLGMYAVWIQQDYHVFVSMMGFKGKEVDGDSGRDELLLPRTIAMSATRANRDSFSNTRLNKLENCTELPRLPERT